MKVDEWVKRQTTKTTKTEKDVNDQNKKMTKDCDTRGFRGSGVKQEADGDETRGTFNLPLL